MNFNAISELVEEARINRSAVLVGNEAGGAEMKALMSMPSGQKRGIHYRGQIRPRDNFMMLGEGGRSDA